MILTLLHNQWRGGSPHLLLYNSKGDLFLELPISRERAAKFQAECEKSGANSMHPDSPAKPRD